MTDREVPGKPGVRPSARARKIAILAVVLVLPLVLLILLVRGSGGGKAPAGGQKAAAGAAAPSGPPPDEPEELPQIRDAAEPGSRAFAGLKEPRDAAVDDRGRIWVADFGNSRLRVFDGQGGFLGGWGGRGSGRHGFRDLCGVAIRGDDIYVADTWNGRVQAYTTAGDWKATAAGLFGPRGVAVGPDGRVWVADTGHNRVLIYGPGLTGEPQVVGKQGSGPGDFLSPVGIVVAPSGSAYVTDTGNRRVVVLESDGALRKSWPVPGWVRPSEPYIEVDRDQTVYVTDPAETQAVLKFDRDGKMLGRVLSSDDGSKFVLPSGLALDQKNRVLYVVSIGGSRVLRVGLDSGKTR